MAGTTQLEFVAVFRILITLWFFRHVGLPKHLCCPLVCKFLNNNIKIPDLSVLHLSVYNKYYPNSQLAIDHEMLSDSTIGGR